MPEGDDHLHNPKHGVGVEPLFRLAFWDCSRACAKGGGYNTCLQHTSTSAPYPTQSCYVPLQLPHLLSAYTQRQFQYFSAQVCLWLFSQKAGYHWSLLFPPMLLASLDHASVHLLFGAQRKCSPIPQRYHFCLLFPFTVQHGCHYCRAAQSCIVFAAQFAFGSCRGQPTMYT